MLWQCHTELPYEGRCVAVRIQRGREQQQCGDAAGNRHDLAGFVRVQVAPNTRYLRYDSHFLSI